MKFNKKIYLYIFVLVACLFFTSINAKAEDKEYTVDNATFEVFFNDNNGDATIVEEWDVNYIKGDFTRFYKDINLPQNQLEHYDDIDILKVSINGKESIESTSLDRVHNHYYFEKGSKNIIGTMHWFYEASHESVHYKVVYNLSNIVKINQDDKAVFCYRFIGDNFPKTVKNVSVILHMDGSYIDDIVLSNGKYEIEADKIVINADNINGIYKVNATMDPSYFGELVRVKDVEISKKWEIDWDVIAIIICFLPFALIILYGLFKYIISGLISLYSAILVSKNPNIFKDAATRIESLNLPYPIYMIIPRRKQCKQNPYLLFYIQIFDLCRRNRAYINNNEIGILCTNVGNNTFMDKIDQAFCKSIITFYDFPIINNYIIINLDKFKSLLVHSIIYPKKFKYLLRKWERQYKRDFYKSNEYISLKQSNNYKQYKKDIKLWHKYSFKRVNPVSLFEILLVFRRNGYLETYMLLSLITNYLLYYYKPSASGSSSYIDDDDSDDTIDDYEMKNNYFNFCFAFDDHYIRSQSSSSNSGSGCSSCSSCSSCSGCGGGGAD